MGLVSLSCTLAFLSNGEEGEALGHSLILSRPEREKSPISDIEAFEAKCAAVVNGGVKSLALFYATTQYIMRAVSAPVGPPKLYPPGSSYHTLINVALLCCMWPS